MPGRIFSEWHAIPLIRFYAMIYIVEAISPQLLKRYFEGNNQDQIIV